MKDQFWIWIRPKKNKNGYTGYRDEPLILDDHNSSASVYQYDRQEEKGEYILNPLAQPPTLLKTRIREWRKGIVR